MNSMTLNATLRLQHYLENNQTFPLHEDVLPHLHAERVQHKLALEALHTEQYIPLGWRSYLETSITHMPNAMPYRIQCIGQR